MAEDRHAGDHAAALAEDEHRVEGIEARPAMLIADQKAGPTGLAGGRPQVGQSLIIAVERLAGGLQRLETREGATGSLTQEHLLV